MIVDVGNTGHSTVGPRSRSVGDTRPTPAPGCANTTWSAFFWRAQASLPFSLTPPWAPPANTTLRNGGYAFRMTLPSAAHEIDRAHVNASEWTPWFYFAAANGTAACATYPNTLFDSPTELVIFLEAVGLPLNAATNVTVEIRPTGSNARPRASAHRSPAPEPMTDGDSGGQNGASYRLNATLAYLSTPWNVAAKSWPNVAESWVLLPLIVAPAASAAPDGGASVGRDDGLNAASRAGATSTSSLPVVTGRGASARYWQAIDAATASDGPGAARMPVNISIVHGYHGKDDAGGWADAARALLRLGGNGMRVYPSVSLGALLRGRSRNPASAGATGGRPSTRAANNSIDSINGSTKRGASRQSPAATGNRDGPSAVNLPFASLMGSTMVGFGPGLSGNATWWGGTQAEVDANLTRWAKSVVTPLVASGFGRNLAQIALHDEPAWHLPADRNLTAEAAAATRSPRGPFGFRFDLPPRMGGYQLERYKAYLASNNVTLVDLAPSGAPWEGALPLSRLNLTAGDSFDASSRRLRFYWGVRFIAWSATAFYASAVAALQAALADACPSCPPLTAYANYNNFHGRLYRPLSPDPTSRNPFARSASGVGAFDWFEAGRLGAEGTVLWTEDWFGDDKASEWSYLGSRMRSAARLGKGRVGWGGYVVPRGPTPGVARGTPGLTLKAMAMVAHGAKQLSYFEFGPEPFFPGNCWTEDAKAPGVYARATEASRLIAAAEPLLYPGATPRASVAFLFPRSSFLWDGVAEEGAASCPGSGSDPEDQGAGAMDYTAVLYGLFKQLTQRLNVQVDFLDEDSVADPAELASYRALVVSEPDVPAEAMGAVARWVAAGGHVLTVSGAALADRYNQTCAVLTDAVGLSDAPRPRRCFASAQALTPVANGTGALGRFSAFGVRGKMRVAPASPTLGPADVVARFDDGTPAVASRRVGLGSATHFSFLPCVHEHGIDPFARAPGFDDPANFTDGSLPYVQAFLSKAGVAPVVTVPAPLMEAPLLVSPSGAVVTLLNWRRVPVPALTLTVTLGFDVGSVSAVNASFAGAPPPTFSSVAAGEGRWNVSVSLLGGVAFGEFVLLHARA